MPRKTAFKLDSIYCSNSMLDYTVYIFSLSLSIYRLIYVVWTDHLLLSSQVKLSVWYVLPCRNELLHWLFKILQTGELQSSPYVYSRNAPFGHVK